MSQSWSRCETGHEVLGSPSYLTGLSCHLCLCSVRFLLPKPKMPFPVLLRVKILHSLKILHLQGPPNKMPPSHANPTPPYFFSYYEFFQPLLYTWSRAYHHKLAYCIITLQLFLIRTILASWQRMEHCKEKKMPWLLMLKSLHRT